MEFPLGIEVVAAVKNGVTRHREQILIFLTDLEVSNVL